MKREKTGLSRRRFIRLAGTGAGLALISPLGTFAAESVSEGFHRTGLSLGCAAGDVTSNATLLWARAERESDVVFHYSKDRSLQGFATTTPVHVTTETDFTAKVAIDGLEPKTTYYYRGAVAGKEPGPICRFMTAPAEEEPMDVRFAFSGDTRESYQPFTIMDSIRLMRPDFFLHLGDTIYADRDEAASRLPQYWAKHFNNRKDLASQRLFCATSLYVTWDDHEVADNFHAAHPLIPVGRKAFFDYWPIRQDPTEPDRLYRSFRWGKAVELFILDCRQYRDSAAGTMLGIRQKEWLLKALSSSSASFKFVATSVPFSSPDSDKWGGFPRERDEILKFIAERKIQGVVFLAADVHYAAAAKVPGGLGLKEFIAGPLAAPMKRPTGGTSKRFEFFWRRSFNYGIVKARASDNPPYAEVEILDQDNRRLYKTRVDVQVV